MCTPAIGHVPQKSSTLCGDSDKTAMQLLYEQPPGEAYVDRSAPEWKRPKLELSSAMSSVEKRQFLSSVNRRTCVIDPRTCKWMLYWDAAMIIALSFTATVSKPSLSLLRPLSLSVSPL